MRCIVIANKKGGVDKTTSAQNLAAALAAHGKKILAVDMDAQANLTRACGTRRRGGLCLACSDQQAACGHAGSLYAALGSEVITKLEARYGS